MQRIVYLLSFIFCVAASFAQPVMPENYFIPPLPGKLHLAGTFGELRPNHFHSGIDLSTQNKQNLEVYSSAAGYVSRIKVSATGYGKVIYITHSEGFVTVYAHLNAFNVVVDDYVNRQQYEQQSFEIELFPDPALFPVRKGTVIGYSGNTGSSAGPHLHYEIRNARTEMPINPLYAGFIPAEVEIPVIEKIVFYPFDDHSLINGQNSTLILETPTHKNKGKPHISDTLTVVGKIGFGIKAYDKYSSARTGGIYSEEILIDSLPFFKIHFDSVFFDDWRYVNTLIDYNTYYTSGDRIVQTYRAPGNRLKIYASEHGKGYYSFSDTNYHQITFTATDFFGNQTQKTIQVKSNIPKPNSSESAPQKLPLFRYGLKEHFEAKDISIDLPANALYDSVYFDYKLFNGNSNTFSGIHQIHYPSVPIHSYVMVKMKPDVLVPDSLKPKLCMVRMVKNNFTYVNSEWEDEWLTARIRSFGNHCIVADTTPPGIKALGTLKNKRIVPDEMLRFKITDNLSGIATYALTINGSWVLAEYDAKYDLLTYKAEARHFRKGDNDLTLTVADNRGNQSLYSVKVLY